VEGAFHSGVVRFAAQVFGLDQAVPKVRGAALAGFEAAAGAENKAEIGTQVGERDGMGTEIA